MPRYDPDNLPEYNEALMCPDCGEKADTINLLWGMFGGGIGPYTMCADCGKIISKSYDSHKDEVVDAEFTEVKDAQGITNDKDESAK